MEVGKYAQRSGVGKYAQGSGVGKYAQGSGHRKKPEMKTEMKTGHQEESRPIDYRLERRQRSLMGVAQARRRTPRMNWERLGPSGGVSSCLVWPISSKIPGVSGGGYVPSLE